MISLKRLLGMASKDNTAPAKPDDPPADTSTPAHPIVEPKNVIHYLGKFEGMTLELDEHVLLLSPRAHNAAKPTPEAPQTKPQPSMTYHPPTGAVCGHYRIVYDDTSYMFWDNPSDAQRAIVERLSQTPPHPDDKARHTYIDLRDAPGGDDFSARDGESPVFTITNMDKRHVPFDRYADFTLAQDTRKPASTRLVPPPRW